MQAAPLRNLLVVSIVVAACAVLSAAPPHADADWRELPLVQDGEIHPDWTHLWGGSFAVFEDGTLRTKCTDEGMGVLLYTRERFGNCQIRVVFRCRDLKSNAGVFVRMHDGVLEHRDDPLPRRERDENGKLTPESLERIQASSEAEREAWYPVHHGYEVQISDAGDEYHCTGAVYSLAPAATMEAPPPGTWRTLLITLEGNRILVDVDGRRASTFDPDDPDVPQRKHWSEPKREHKRPISGYIGLQNHDPGDVVDFREISVRPLPADDSLKE